MEGYLTKEQFDAIKSSQLKKIEELREDLQKIEEWADDFEQVLHTDDLNAIVNWSVCNPLKGLKHTQIK